MIRVVVADDQALVRGGFRYMIDSQPDLEVVGEAENGREALQLVRTLAPDLVVMDVRMPEMDGIEATRRIASTSASTKVLMLTTFDLDEHIYDAMSAGASAFLLKDVPPEQLVAGIRRVAAGESLVAPTITRRLIERFLRQPDRDDAQRLTALTDREREVLQLVARGRSNQEIAADLSLAEPTVKTHVTRIYMKLGVRDRAQAVVLAYETGVVRPGQ